MYKITLSEFWNSKEILGIRCKTKEKAKSLLKAFDKLGKTWYGCYSYLRIIKWQKYKENTVYSNSRFYNSLSYYQERKIKIYDFDEVDLEN